MGRCRVVQPLIDRLPLSDGDWIEVKRDINTGEAKILEEAGMKPPIRADDGRIVTPINWGVYELERAFIYLTDWSLKDAQDKIIKLSMDGIKSIDPETFEEIDRAIINHIAKRSAEKKAERLARMETTQTPQPLTEPASEATSGS